MGEKMFEMKAESVQDILNYLATRPYQEVAQLIGKVQEGKIVEPEAKE